MQISTDRIGGALVESAVIVRSFLRRRHFRLTKLKGADTPALVGPRLIRAPYTPPGITRAAAAVIAITALSATGLVAMPAAAASPDPRVEFLWDVTVRRHYVFPNNDPLQYGYTICEKVTAGEPYGKVMGDVKSEVLPNDEYAANYLVSYAVDMLCENQITKLRDSAAYYQRPPR